jgi:hypothetical protein
MKTITAKIKGNNGLAARFTSVLCLGGLLAVILSGCTQKPNSPVTTAKTQWSWDKYPPVEKMRLATLPCQVQPKTSLIINAPISGQLRLNISSPQTNLQSDFVWAEFEPKVLNMEAAELAEAKRKIEERERLFREIELPKERIKLTKEVAEARKQLMLLSLVSTNPALGHLAISASGGAKEGGVLKSGSLEEAKKELALMEENLKYLSTTNPAILGMDIEGARLELQRRQLEFERRQAQARFKMPFVGQLITSLQLAEGVTEYPVSAGQELAVVRDLKCIVLRVPLEDVAWTALSAARLTAVLHLPDGTQLEAPFAYKKLERSQLREEVFYYFQFPFEESTSAAQLVGADLSCELWLGLTQPARIVPKLALVMQEPNAFQNRHWNEGIAQILPGAQVLIEGQTDLAILPAVPQVNPDKDKHLSLAIPKK